MGYLRNEMPLIKNMGFYGFNLLHIGQIFLFNVYTIFAIYFNMFQSYFPSVYSTEVYIVLLNIIVRLIIINVKYSTLNPKKYQHLKKKVLTLDEFSDNLLLNFQTQTEKIIENEILNAIVRQDINMSNFYIDIQDKNFERMKQAGSVRAASYTASNFAIPKAMRKSVLVNNEKDLELYY